MRGFHRIFAFFIVFFLLYMGVTGAVMQFIDLRALLTHAPASDLDMQAIRDSIDGPPHYVVIGLGDYDATALPGDFDFAASLGATLRNARGAAAGGPITWIDWRMEHAGPVAQFKIPGRLLTLNAGSGAVVGNDVYHAANPKPPPSFRHEVKNFHRGQTALGDWSLFGLVVGVALGVMIVSGLVVWARLYADQRRLKRFNVFWSAGSAWRRLHRAIALVFSLFLLVIAITGALLQFDSVYHGIVVARTPDRFNRDASSPLADAGLPGMLTTTLGAFHRDHPATPIKALRLRFYSGYAQGVVIAGGSETRQFVYNARDGRSMSETEPGYAPVYYPFGWQAHETLKEIHRGDYFGLSGRVMGALSGLALIYLSISGIVMYLELWVRRRGIGRKALLW